MALFEGTEYIPRYIQTKKNIVNETVYHSTFWMLFRTFFFVNLNMHTTKSKSRMTYENKTFVHLFQSIKCWISFWRVESMCACACLFLMADSVLDFFWSVCSKIKDLFNFRVIFSVTVSLIFLYCANYIGATPHHTVLHTKFCCVINVHLPFDLLFIEDIMLDLDSQY